MATSCRGLYRAPSSKPMRLKTSRGESNGAALPPGSKTGGSGSLWTNSRHAEPITGHGAKAPGSHILGGRPATPGTAISGRTANHGARADAQSLIAGSAQALPTACSHAPRLPLREGRQQASRRTSVRANEARCLKSACDCRLTTNDCRRAAKTHLCQSFPLVLKIRYAQAQNLAGQDRGRLS